MFKLYFVFSLALVLVLVLAFVLLICYDVNPSSNINLCECISAFFFTTLLSQLVEFQTWVRLQSTSRHGAAPTFFVHAGFLCTRDKPKDSFRLGVRAMVFYTCEQTGRGSELYPMECL